MVTNSFSLPLNPGAASCSNDAAAVSDVRDSRKSLDKTPAKFRRGSIIKVSTLSVSGRARLIRFRISCRFVRTRNGIVSVWVVTKSSSTPPFSNNTCERSLSFWGHVKRSFTTSGPMLRQKGLKSSNGVTSRFLANWLSYHGINFEKRCTRLNSYLKESGAGDHCVLVS